MATFQTIERWYALIDAAGLASAGDPVAELRALRTALLKEMDRADQLERAALATAKMVAARHAAITHPLRGMPGVAHGN